MKRIIALLTTLAMLLSFTAVFADENVSDRFEKVMNTSVTSGIMKMSLSLEAKDEQSAKLFDLSDSSELPGFEFNIKMNGNEEQTKLDADMDMIIKMSGESMSAKMWLKLDMSDAEKPIYYAVITSNDVGFGNDKYIYIDYTKLPQIASMLDTFKAMGLFDKEKSAEISKALLSGAENIEPAFENGKYTLVLSEAQIKSFVGTIFKNITAAAGNMPIPGGNTEELDDVLSAVADVLSEAKLFDSERALVLTVGADENDRMTDMSMTLNIDTNICDIANLIAPGEETGLNREEANLKLAVNISCSMEYPEGAIEISFPEFTAENSVDMTELMTGVYGGDASSVGIIGGADGPTAIYTGGGISVIYNGNAVDLSENMPVLEQDRTFLPLRKMANIFGISDENISYDEATERISIKDGDTEIVMTVGDTNVYINGEATTVDVPVFTVNDRTYLPARFVAETFGKTVDYTENESGLTVYITD